MEKKNLLLIDAHSQIYKAYYGIRGLSTSKGFPTGAIYGFLLSLRRVIRELAPDLIAVVFDSKEPSFRKDIYPEYKANRQIMPEDLQIQIKYIFDILNALHIKILRQGGLEADDIIGLLARKAARSNYNVFILTADKDLLQLVNDSIKVLSAGRQGEELKEIDREKVKEKLGVYPEQVTDLLGLMGDSSDNIPGIRGVGPKTALKLLDQFGSLESVLENSEKIDNEKLRQKITENTDIALLSKRLSTIPDDVPFEINLKDFEIKGSSDPVLAEIYRKLEFESLLKETGGIGAGEIKAKIKIDEEEPLMALMDVGEKIENKGEIALLDGKVSEDDTLLKESPFQNYIRGEYKTLFKIDEIRAFVENAQRYEWLAIDTETTSENSMRADLVGISMSVEEGKAVYIPIGHNIMMSPQPQPDLNDVKQVLNSLFLDIQVKKCGQNLKYDLEILERSGFTLSRIYFDTMLASYLLNPDRQSHSLKSLSIEYLNLKMTTIKELIGSGKNIITMDNVEVEKVSDYSCADADATLRLTKLLYSKLKESGLLNLMENVEVPLIEVLKNMEMEGVRIDIAYFKKLGEEFRRKLKIIEEKAYEIADKKFNLNSPKQISEILFNELKLAPQKRGKTGYSTDVSVLQALSSSHPLPKLLLEYRELEKLNSTYVESLIELVNQRTGKIHTSFNQTIAATGRLSSSNPNLQNIPARTIQGRQIRRGFIPRESGWIFLSADYSQIELRILASITGDEALTKAFQEDIDIHKLTASKVFGAKIEDVTPEMRDQAKVINFGIIYGMTAHRLYNELGIPRRVAQQFIEDYFRAYVGVKKWIDSIIRFARENGYVETLMGRRRFISNINSKNANLRNAAERIAINAPIQGTSADMIKVAMINIHWRLISEGYKGKMILQVHDELFFDLPQNEQDKLSRMAKEEMEKALPLNLPVKVGIKVGPNWAEC